MIMPLDAYVKNKRNGHMLIIGQNGSGKSYLSGNILTTVKPEIRRVCLSYKDDDIALHLGYLRIKVSEFIPNIFENVDDFLACYAIAYPVNTIGMMALDMKTQLQEILVGVKMWNNLENKIKSMKTSKFSATVIEILNRAINSLNLHQRTIDIPKENIVFDFSGIGIEKAAFYSEAILRWMRRHDNHDVLIYVEEARHIFRPDVEKFHSPTILNFFITEDRYLNVNVLAVSQNLSDIPDDNVRSQFATQFAFRLESSKDYDRLRGNPLLQHAVSVLPLYCFTDLSYDLRHDNVPVFVLNWKMQDKGFREFVAPQVAIQEKEQTSVPTTSNEFVEKLASMAMTKSELAKALGYDNKNDTRKIKMGREIDRLCKEQDGTRQLEFEEWYNHKYAIKEDGKEKGKITVYFKPGTEALHVRGMKETKTEIENLKLKILSEAVHGVGQPDFELERFYVEFESGRKNSTKLFVENVKQLSQHKRVIVVTPNPKVKSRYIRELVPTEIGNNFQVVLLSELKEALQN
jgi:hypothetical protein